ncbi:hypothetical protein TNCV_4830281 [Trichonephila clavipes]|nr:hypothetical protein TNCV_4830281 [Trichonephila clavipes]
MGYILAAKPLQARQVPKCEPFQGGIIYFAEYQSQIDIQGIIHMPHNHMTCMPTILASLKPIDSSRDQTGNLGLTKRDTLPLNDRAGKFSIEYQVFCEKISTHIKT